MSVELDNTLIKLSILIIQEKSTTLHAPQREGGVFLPGAIWKETSPTEINFPIPVY